MTTLRSRRQPALAALCLLTGLITGSACARTNLVTPQATRTAEMASCQPGERITWPDGHDRPAPGRAVHLFYRHTGAPPTFDEATVLGTLQRAAAAWSTCGVPAAVLPDSEAGLDPTTEVQVRWDSHGTRGNFALADLGRRQLWLSPAMFALLAQRNPRHPAIETLQMAISHEMGHFFGLMAHSRRCIDVMSYYTDGRGGTCITRDGGSYKAAVEYRALLPTACDIARCRAINGR